MKNMIVAAGLITLAVASAIPASATPNPTNDRYVQEMYAILQDTSTPDQATYDALVKRGHDVCDMLSVKGETATESYFVVVDDDLTLSEAKQIVAVTEDAYCPKQLA
jgi:hypothetical protein